MPTYINTNDNFGDEGPFQAESREALADEMKDWFKEMAIESWQEEEYGPDAGEMQDQRPAYIRNEMSQLRREFISGLREVKQNSRSYFIW